MYRQHTGRGRPPRRGLVLAVVLALLTLFAALGLAFVWYADSAATAAHHCREGENLDRPDLEPELLLAYFLGQLIYDVDDDGPLDSALRGHSLARSMYGWNADDPDGNDTAFNGTGRLHEPIVIGGGGTPAVLDGYDLVNYTCFRDRSGLPSDGLIRDPERLGTRPGPGRRGPYTGGFNASYTYPDLNNMFLAAVKADGTVLVPSFHRPWRRDPKDPKTGFGPLDPANPNWYDTTRPWLKYLVLRPRPADHAGFPAPEDAGGDVKNLLGTPGGNDSVWLDLGFPVRTLPDGRKFKALFAPLVVDLDNRVNVNVHGNIRGAAFTHLSNQGWGPWEVSLSQVLTRGGEWANLFAGTPRPFRTGRYGADGRPGAAASAAPFGPRPHSYAQADFDAANEGPGGRPTGRFLLPGRGAPALTCFPSFPAGYGNGRGGRPGTELWQHPRGYNVFRPAGDDRRFALSNLEKLLRHGDTGSEALTSELVQLCPANFRDARTRRLVTTDSFDLDRPGAPPWPFDRAASAYQLPLGDPNGPPAGPPVAFPALSLRASAVVPSDSDFRTPGAGPDSPGVDWRSRTAALGRVDLNRFLPPYPHQGRGLTAATYRAEPLVDAAGRFDAGGAAVRDQFLAAQRARQQLADDIYRRLLAVTGVAEPEDPASPSDTDLAPRRWLAQLAVNIVDYIDEDDISTPFNFYTAADAGDVSFNAGAASAGNPELPRYWVFGTELPRVVVNEALAEYRRPAKRASGTAAVRVWVELFNPLPPGPAPAGTQPQDAQPVPLFIPGAGDRAGYGPYQVVLANTNGNPGGPLLPRSGNRDNVLGTPDVVRAETGDADFAKAAGLAPQGFLLLGPPGADAHKAIAPPLVPAATPWVRSRNLQYPVTFTPPDTWFPDDRPGGLTVLLRRLANPHLPYDGRPALGRAPNPTYNPYVTVDYLGGIPLNNATNPAAVYSSRGKLQPYAADPSQVALQAHVPGSATWHTFGRPNDPVPASGRYDWLVHLDRPLISPMELLHVCGHPPHQLTRRFIIRNSPTGPVRRFNHRVPWFEETNRLYRLFELLQTHDRAAGVVPGGRVPGQINLNTVWDVETFRALCDPQPGNSFTPADVDQIFARLTALRTPGGRPGPNDRPFLSLAVGPSPRPGDALYPTGGDPLFPRGSGINETLLRSAAADGGADTRRLLEVPGAAHPYLRDELMTKIFNHVTTRSNVFAVWLTVGFFEVSDDTTRPVKLGAEFGRAQGRPIRHRMFAVVDRTGLTVFTTRSTTAVTVPPGEPSVSATVRPVQMAGTAANGLAWHIRAGSLLVVEPGTDREETVLVTAAGVREFRATFRRSHPRGFGISRRGNPGPWPRFDPHDHPTVVPYFSIID
jgi:hypothetical protein